MSTISPTEELGGLSATQAIEVAQTYLSPNTQGTATSGKLTAFNASLESFSLFETAFENVEVVSALLNQEYDDTGNLQDIMDVTFRIIGRPGLFQVHPYYAVNWIAQAFFLIGIKHAIVEGIYQGLAEPAVIPQPVTPGGAPGPQGGGFLPGPGTIPQPGVPIPA